MAVIVLYILLVLSYVAIPTHPYFSVLVYYLFAVLQPQTIWWWAFGNLRASFITALAAIIGFLFSFLQNPDFSVWKHKEVFCLLALWLWIGLSILFGGLPCQFYGGANSNALWLITELSKIYLMVLICIYLIDTSDKIFYLSIIFIISVIYLSYWGNMQYLTGAIWRNPLGRLNGPHTLNGVGIYKEENVFGMFFVTSLPFLYYSVLLFKNKWIRLFLLPWIPLGWSAIFLTASRGALLGLAVTILHVIVRFKQKFIGILLLIALVVFFIWQGGSVMKNRADTLDNPETAGRMRLTSWQLALDMMKDYPIFGVGLGNFMKARNELYGNSRRLIAMNTLLQFGAECGIPAMLFLIGMTIFALKDLNILMKSFNPNNILYVITISVECSIWGFMVCGFFLSAHLYEPFYLFIAMTVSLKNILSSGAYSTTVETKE